jgi:hypothetical protein
VGLTVQAPSGYGRTDGWVLFFPVVANTSWRLTQREEELKNANPNLRDTEMERIFKI